MDALWTPQYYQKVLALDPVAYWMLDEKSGTVAYDLVSGRVAGAQNGAYTGVTLGQPGIGDGRTGPFYDGTNDYTNAYSAALAAAFNGAEGTVMIWSRVANAGAWTDGNERRHLTLLADGNNYILVRKAVANNTLQWFYNAGAVFKGFTVGGYATTDFFQTAITWSATADEVSVYYNGALAAATLNGLGVWAGALNAIFTVIGAADLVPTSSWNGGLAHCAVWDRPLPLAEIAALYVVPAT